MTDVVRSFAETNLELVEAFERYLVSRGMSQSTILNYKPTANAFVEMLGSRSIAEADRATVRVWMSGLLAKGNSASTVEARRCAIKAFFQFIKRTGLLADADDPTLHLGPRKMPFRLRPVPTVEQMEQIIAAAETPLERAVIEVLYGSGVRISELRNLRVENIDFGMFDGVGSIRILSGKGNKDRVAIFGAPAAKAIKEYQCSHPSTTGFLFEAPLRSGRVFRSKRLWRAFFCVDGIEQVMGVGKVSEMSEEQARESFERLAAHIPGFHPMPARQYTQRGLYLVVKRVATRAGIPWIYPHALRRAFASHLLVRSRNIRVVQELLGHNSLSSTMRYTGLTGEDLEKVHREFHPHGGGNEPET